jgi:predicted ATPase/DNA-binding winged helix-turn-helix (wHTH) protein
LRPPNKNKSDQLNGGATQRERSQVMNRELSPTTVSLQPSEQKARFGTFQLLPKQRLLLDDGKRVPIGSRAFDILMMLIENAGRVVTKEQLMVHAWPHTVVEETNLRVHISALRRALGDDQGHSRYLSNVIGRGYSFVNSVIWESEPIGETALAATQTPQSISPRAVPTPLTRIVGRSKDMDFVVSTLPRCRFLSVLGGCGVGKSALVQTAGFELQGRYRHGAYLIDLAAIPDAASLPVSLALAMGLSVSVNDPMLELCMGLRDRHILVVLDNCDHLVSAAAKLAESILQSAAGAHILASSREPLGAQGEWQHRLEPLEVPRETELETPTAAMSYPAVQLFVERAVTSAQRFELTVANAQIVSSICRRLDGVPLAIELAAARVSVLGVQGLAARLDDRFMLEERGRRTATTHHQTLRAAFDWSYDLLAEPEQIILRRLAIFRGPFLVESAIDIAAHGQIGAEQALLGIMSLADKSFIITDITEERARHRLLNTTRDYALGKLAASSDKDDIYAWHAQHHLELLRKAATERWAKSSEEQTNSPDFAIEELPAAIEWAFSPAGNPSLGAQLIVASLALDLPLAHLDELRTRVEQALEHLDDLSSTHPDIKSQLNSVLHLLPSTMECTEGLHTMATRDAELSETSAIIKYQVQPLIFATVTEIEGGRYGNAVSMARRLSTVIRGIAEPTAALIADRLMAQALHYAGKHRAARTLAEKVIGSHGMVIPLTFSRFSLDAGVSMRVLIARMLWIEGLVDQAMRMADECVGRSRGDGSYSLCQALALAASPICLWRGDHDGCAERAGLLRDRAIRHRHGRWQPYAEWYIAIAQGSPGIDSFAQQPAPGAPVTSVSGLLLDTTLTVSPWITGGEDAALVRGGPESWCAAELLRLQAMRLLRHEAPSENTRAEALLLASLALARGQGALSWELRTASSLSTLWAAQSRHREALDLLAGVYGRFTEGHDTHDLKHARALLQRLEQVSRA